MKGENLLFSVTGKLYSYLGGRKFRRDMSSMGKRALNYEEIKEHWNTDVLVHGDILTNELGHFSCINEVMKFEDSDNIVDIGCGDGRIDSHIYVNKLYGIDISEKKIAAAKDRNPKYVYQVQSFLTPVDYFDVNKVFSYSVAQYCKPDDLEKMIKNSIDIVLKSKSCGKNRMVAHLDVPDIEKAYIYYHSFYGVSLSTFESYKNHIKIIFKDGSYWHDLRKIKKICEDYIGGGVVYIEPAHCYYRSNLVILL